jgi:hypothetical protein
LGLRDARRHTLGGPVPLAGLVILALAVAACGSAAGTPAPTGSGRGPKETTMPEETTTGATAPAPTAPEATAGRDGGFRLASPDFPDGGAIPRRYTCDGEDESPPLTWEGAPDSTATLALIVDDPDARGFVHWVVYNLTGSQTGGLAAGISASPDAPPQGKNDFGKIGWGGPCPPSGSHHYRFTLLAVDDTLDLSGAPTADEVRDAASGHIVDEALLTGTYRRG